MRRKRAGKPNLSTQVACLLLYYLESKGQGIPYEEAKRLTVKQINARVRWDHVVHDVWGGSLHPTNLTPRLVAESRHLAATRDIPQIAKVKRMARKAIIAPPRWSDEEIASIERWNREPIAINRIDVTGAMADGPECPSSKVRSRPMPYGKASPKKRKLNGKVVDRD